MVMGDTARIAAFPIYPDKPKFYLVVVSSMERALTTIYMAHGNLKEILHADIFGTQDTERVKRKIVRLKIKGVRFSSFGKVLKDRNE